MNLPLLKSPEGADPVVVELELRAPQSRVFAAWTTEDDVMRWFGAGRACPEFVSLDPREGGLWKVTFAESDGQVDSLGGRYLSVVQDQLLQFTWIHTRHLPDGNTERSGESTVTIQFEDSATGTTIKLRHEAVAERQTRLNIGGGWSSSLVKLQKLLEHSV